MHILATEIQSDDGAANAAVAEAAERLAEQHMRITRLEGDNDALKQHIKGLEQAGDELAKWCHNSIAIRVWCIAKEATP